MHGQQDRILVAAAAIDFPEDRRLHRSDWEANSEKIKSVVPAGIPGVLGQPLLKGLSAADVAAIRIAGPEGALTLARKDDRWIVAEHGDFPADYAKVRAFVLKAGELKIGQSEPIGEPDRARLALVAPGDDAKGGKSETRGTLVEFQSAAGKPLAGVIVGAKSAVTKDIDAGAHVTGIPAGPVDEWRESAVLVRRLPEFRRLLTDLDARLRELEARIRGSGLYS